MSPGSRAHIVYAHPESRSFVAAMRDVVEDSLRSQSWRVTSSNLYARGFNPVASSEDFGTRRDPDYLTYALEQRHGYENGTLAERRATIAMPSLLEFDEWFRRIERQ